MKNTLVLILLFSLGKFYCQDSTQKRLSHFQVQVGLSESIPFHASYNETYGQKNSSIYSSFRVDNQNTFGYFAAVEYAIALNKNLAIVPAVSYYFSQEKTIKTGESQCGGCNIPIEPFAGVRITENKFHTLAISAALEYRINKFIFSSGVGVNSAFMHETKNYTKNYLNGKETSYTATYNSINGIERLFSYHQLGVEVIKHRLDLCAGVYLVKKSEYLSRSVNPTLSFKFKL